MRKAGACAAACEPAACRLQLWQVCTAAAEDGRPCWYELTLLTEKTSDFVLWSFALMTSGASHLGGDALIRLSSEGAAQQDSGPEDAGFVEYAVLGTTHTAGHC